MLLKYCTQYASKFGKLSNGHRTGKGSAFIPIPKKGNAKQCSNYCTTELISHASKAMLKILQVRLQQCMNQELQMYKMNLEKAEKPEIKLLTSDESQRKQENSRKTSTSASLTMQKPLTVWITTNCRKFLKRWECQTTLPVSWVSYIWTKKQQLEPYIEQLFQIGKTVRQDCILSPCLFNFYADYIKQKARLMNHKLELRLLVEISEISITSDIQMIWF